MLDTTILNHLHDLVLLCDRAGMISFANAAARRMVQAPLEAQPFGSLLSPESRQKGELFLRAATAACPDAPTTSWELPLGDALNNTIAHFHGYCINEQLVVIGAVEPDAMGEMQRELLALTSELSEAQRDQRRQNRQLQQALAEQRHLLDTIQALAAPAVPIWDRVLLLPLVGHFDSQRANQVNRLLLERAAQSRARFVILELSGIALVDTAVAQQLIQTAQALRLLGVQPILVGVNPEIAQTVVNLGIDLPGFVIKRDLHGALAFVLARLGVTR